MLNSFFSLSSYLTENTFCLNYEKEKLVLECSAYVTVNTIAGDNKTSAVPWLRRLVPGLLPRRPVFDPLSVHVIFVLDTVAVEQVFIQVYRFSPVSNVPLLFHSRLCIHVALIRRSSGRSLGILQK